MKNEILKKLNDDILCRISDEGADFLDTVLEKEGYRLDEINSLTSKAFKRQKFLLRGKLSYEKDLKLLEYVSHRLQQEVENNTDKPITFLKNLIKENRLGVQYRNLDKLTNEEIKEMIKNQNLIQLLEMLDQKDES